MTKDFIRLLNGPLAGKLWTVSVWPPPPFISADEVAVMCAIVGIEMEMPMVYRLVRHSNLTDEMASHPNLARGAEYEVDMTIHPVP